MMIRRWGWIAFVMLLLTFWLSYTESEVQSARRDLALVHAEHQRIFELLDRCGGSRAAAPQTTPATTTSTKGDYWP